MAAQRPRPSVLSLFDPLTSSQDSDKENDYCETSFFHPSGFQKQRYSHKHNPRCRLVDIGDITVDEPDIQDLLEDEEALEAEIIHSVAIDEDENATLTFRDMAKAATPKWSAQRNGHREDRNSVSIPSPRTPLAEIVLKGDEIPIMVGRKQMLWHPVAFNAQVDSSLENPRSSLPKHPSITNSLPKIEISDDDTNTSTFYPSESSQRSFSRDPATPIGTSVNASSIPVAPLIRPPKSLSISPHLTGSKLRPNVPLNVSNRFSVDLNASFQLHMQASETTFDLLNDKISFFGSTGLDASLEEGDLLFDDHEGVGISKSVSVPVNNDIHERHKLAILQEFDGKPKLDQEPISNAESDQTTSLPENQGVHEGNGSTGIRHGIKTVSAAGMDLPTPMAPPSAIHCPPRLIPALKIIKRSKVSDQPKAGVSDARQSSTVAGAMPSHLRTGKHQDVFPNHGMENGGHARGVADYRAVAKPDGIQSGNGPRRVLVSDGPIPPAKVQLKPAVCSFGGARRVATTTCVDAPSKSSSSSIKQAGQSATVGPFVSASSIPKPVSRHAGSRIPAPNSHRQRFGV